jgi:hypothetical protein
MELREQIERAFEFTPAPAGRIVDTLQDDEGVSDYFRGKPWRGHKVEDLRFHDAALSFFTAEAFRYYLPAFMLASIDDPIEADVIPGGILYHFSAPDDPRQWGRISALAPAELDAVAAFVRSLADGHNDGEILAILEGLERAKASRPREAGR